MRKCAWLLLLSFMLLLVGCGNRRPSEPTDSHGAKTTARYLLVGLDEAAENTDVLMLVDSDPMRSSIRVLQIPRDTYLRSGYAQNKINQIYAARRALGDSAGEALGHLTALVGDALGIALDGAVGVTLRSFRQTVDLVGGVDVTFDADYRYTDPTDGATLDFPRGTHHLDGAAAEHFVRYRKGYAMGDLSRMDAQKIFMASFFRTLASKLTVTNVLPLIATVSDGLVFHGSALNFLKTAPKFISEFKNRSIVFLTMPGEPTTADNGLSYFVVSRAACEQMIADLYGASRFDAEERFNQPNLLQFDNIYRDRGRAYRSFDEDAVRDIRIPRAKP